MSPTLRFIGIGSLSWANAQSHSCQKRRCKTIRKKLKGHGLVEREPGKYAYRLTEKGRKTAILMLLFHQRLCGPLAGSQLQHRPDVEHRPKESKLEKAYYRADHAIDGVLAALRAA